jgi:hypothetical protein
MKYHAQRVVTDIFFAVSFALYAKEAKIYPVNEEEAASRPPLYYNQTSSIASKLSLSRKMSEMHQTPARATIVYMILLTTDIGPPQIHATISKLKSPMLPQLRAPITVRIRAILSIIIMVLYPLCLWEHPAFLRKCDVLISDTFLCPMNRAVIIFHRKRAFMRNIFFVFLPFLLKLTFKSG